MGVSRPEERSHLRSETFRSNRSKYRFFSSRISKNFPHKNFDLLVLIYNLQEKKYVCSKLVNYDWNPIYIFHSENPLSTSL